MPTKQQFSHPVLCSLLVVLGLGSSGCSDRGAADDRPPVLVIAVDGMEWHLLNQFLLEGKLPNIHKLTRGGIFGTLKTVVPTYSPRIWTTVATGKFADDHGIPEFSYRDRSGSVRLYTSGHRRSKALWNILSDYDRTVHCIGWWCTYPAEEIQGVMVAQTSTRNQVDTRYGRNVWKGGVLEDIPHQVHPPEFEPVVLDIAAETNARLDQSIKEIFGEPTHELSNLSKTLWENTRWAISSDNTYLSVTDRVLKDDPNFDLAMVYFGTVDVVSHRFFRYLLPDLYKHPPTPEEIRDFGTTIESAYIWVDDAVGKLRRWVPDATVILLSDHGFGPVNLEGEFDPDNPPKVINSGDHQEGPPGVFLAWGPNIRQGDLRIDLDLRTPVEEFPELGEVSDVAPTLLMLQGIPVGKDMAGKPMTHLFTEEFLRETSKKKVKSHEDEEWKFARAKLRREAENLEKQLEVGGFDEEEYLEELRALGYAVDEVDSLEENLGGSAPWKTVDEDSGSR